MLSYKSPWRTLPIKIPHDHSEFVIGDVHGCAEQLNILLYNMSVSASRKSKHMTFLGDLVDRGPDSIGSIRLAANKPLELGFGPATLLTGNHEALMLASMRILPLGLSMYHASEADYIWNCNGGSGVIYQLTEMAGNAERSQGILQHVLGEHDYQFLIDAQKYLLIGNLLLCHAGLHPVWQLDEWFKKEPWPIYSEDQSWCWVREPFIHHEEPFKDDMFVVHGHTMEIKTAHLKDKLYKMDKPYKFSALHVQDHSRLGLDGGSFMTGIVAGAQFENGRYRLFGVGDETLMQKMQISF